MVNIKFSKMWEAIKEWAVEQGIRQPEGAYTMYNSVHDDTFHNPFMEPVDKRDEWEKDDYPEKEKADVVYFKGCSQSYYEYKTLLNAMKILTKAGVNFTTLGKDEMCCGAPLEMAGLVDKQKEIAEHNVNAIKKKGAKLLVTSCPGCLRAIRRYEEFLGKKLPFKVRHVTELVSKLLKAGKIELKEGKKFKKVPIIYHDPCELSRIGELEGNLCYEPPRDIIKVAAGEENVLEFDDNRIAAACCGGGGIMKAVDLQTAQAINMKKIREAIDKGAATIVSACPSCNMTFGVGVNLMKDELKAKGEKLKLDVADVLDVLSKVVK
jgi:Fe-S oxidoreductase